MREPAWIEMAAFVSDTEAQLVEIARATLRDLRQPEAGLRRITLDSTLDHDLGLDSLGRVELFARIERDLHVRLPAAVFATAERLQDIAVALGGPLERTAPDRDMGRSPLQTRADASAPPGHIGTLSDVLAWHAEQHPEFNHVTLIDEDPPGILTYASLWQRSRTIAAGLQAQGVRMGDTIALMLPTSRAYFVGFFGILLAGAIPVPLYPPTRPSQVEEHVRRHTGILNNAAARILITTEPMRRVAGVLRAHVPSIAKVMSLEELATATQRLIAVIVKPQQPALIQYTSGSTGQPKGVVLTHANILANLTALGAALDIQRTDVFVSWLPLYHDMGLIGAWLGSLYFAMPLVIMSPLTFLTRPARWLEAIHRYHGTMTASPNFGYELCLKRIDDAELQGVNLGSLRVAMNGAEAVMPQTLARFQERFARCGLDATAMTPVYGLAECSVGLAVPPMKRGPLLDTIERASFMTDGIAVPARTDRPDTLQFVSCGAQIPRHEVRIVDEHGRAVGDRHEGRLEFRGPSTTSGYFRNPDATARLLHDHWVDSGDRAYQASGEIYVTGRIKDIVIRAGRHIYPDELEAAVGALPGVRKGCVAVFGNLDSSSGTEQLIVVAETRVTDTGERQRVRQSIVDAVVDVIGEPPDEVMLTVPHSVLKTSSGKLRRAATRELYVAGKLTSPDPAWKQLLRLAVTAVIPAARRTFLRTRDFLYGIYFWTTFIIIGVPTLLVALLPLPSQAVWSMCHCAARVFLRVARVPLDVKGQELIERGTNRVIVANHSSYLDGIFLLAAIPYRCRFVAKRELARTPIVGTFLRHLDALFVERFDVRGSVADANHLTEVVAQGASCISFPEGTFTRAPGLMPFHLGAFSAATESGVAVLPIALNGTRGLLRDEQWLPRRTAVVVHIAPPIAPKRDVDPLSASVDLRDAARQAIGTFCGEPDLLGQIDRLDEQTKLENSVQLHRDPSSMFASPAALLDCETLSDAQKIALLREWHYDALEIAVAEEEGMPCRDSDLVRETVLSLQQLAPLDMDHVGPGKQHGITLAAPRNELP